MTYQIRHRKLGVFQGECMGLGFWHPMSEMPEQGFLEFPDYEAASGYRAFLASSACSSPLDIGDLTIEPYDRDTSERLRREHADADHS